MLILFPPNIPNLTLHCLFVFSFSAKLHSNWKNIFQRIEEYKVLISLSSLTLCNPVDCSPLGSSMPGMLLTSILEWVTIPSPAYLPDPGIQPRISHILDRSFTF